MTKISPAHINSIQDLRKAEQNRTLSDQQKVEWILENNRLEETIEDLENEVLTIVESENYLRQELETADGRYRELESRVKTPDELVKFTDEEERELRAVYNMGLFTQNTPIDTLIESGQVEVDEWIKRAEKYGVATAKGVACLDAAYRLEFQLGYFRVRNGEIPVTEEARKMMQERIDERDLARYTRFKRWAKDNLVGFSAIPITIGGIITSVVIGLKKGVTTVATAAWSLGHAFAHIATKVGPIIGSLFSFIGAVLSFGSKAAFFIASNLWTLFLFLVSAYYYNRRKIKNHGRR